MKGEVSVKSIVFFLQSKTIQGGRKKAILRKWNARENSSDSIFHLDLSGFDKKTTKPNQTKNKQKEPAFKIRKKTREKTTFVALKDFPASN